MQPAVEAVLFDMDGTLVHSQYDWPSIRAELGVEGPSLIDGLNALPEDKRSLAWARMCEIEVRASREARVVDGARELLDLLGRRRIRTALVTNNTGNNALELTRRFGLELDVVLTRDSGLYKPSGAPLVEAMRRLGVDSARTMAVGDSMYDIRSAREADCAWVVVVNGGVSQHHREADYAFRDLNALHLFLSRGLGDTIAEEAKANRTTRIGLKSRKR